MPFALAALILAARSFPGWGKLGLVIGAVVTARIAAMAFNRIVDVRFDAVNPRTVERHLPSRRMSMSTAWCVVVVTAGMFIFLSMSINALAGKLSPVALAIVFGYSFTKRFTCLSHFFLGIALSLAPLGGWVAVRANLGEVIPWLLALAVICWVAGFDILYALQDAEFDKTHGLHSMVVALGPRRCLKWVRFLHAVMLLILGSVGLLLNLGWPYFAGLGIVLASLVWEQRLIQRLNLGNLQQAFLQANAVASFGYLGAVIGGVFLGN